MEKFDRGDDNDDERDKESDHDQEHVVGEDGEPVGVVGAGRFPGRGTAKS